MACSGVNMDGVEFMAGGGHVDVCTVGLATVAR